MTDTAFAALPVSAGRPHPLGATFDGTGVNFALFSAHATRVTLCLFSPDGKREERRVDLAWREGDIWHARLEGLRPGTLYGYRVDGPYEPHAGHRFNANKLLIDPYAKRLTGHPRWKGAVFGYQPRSRNDTTFDTRDSAPFMPRCVVVDPAFTRTGMPRLDTPFEESLIYEAHVKGLTQLHPHASPRGTYLGMASDPVLDHLTRLGVTAIELLPVHAFINDEFLTRKGLTNYWGYQSIGFFAPEPRYMGSGDIHEFQQMVARFHAAGIEVLLDVVYNHTGEGNEMGPTLCFRGIDNASYYRLLDDARYYVNDTGTGNTLDTDHPMVLRMVLDSLRYWVEVMGVDGFRFDLAATLGRTATGFETGAALLDAIRQDPVLAGRKLIAEPWDIGPGGYQLGAFPPPFREWNDRYRDTMRGFWKREPGALAAFGNRLLGTAHRFDHSGRHATTSINFLTAHDGFTLHDVVSFNDKHNDANGEDNRDGHGHNLSDNMGVEGPTDDPAINEARARRKRAMLATLFLSQGVPMLLAGDEIGNTQHGNNNAYAQDNEIGWVDWPNADERLADFVGRLAALRRAHPALRQPHFLHSRERESDGRLDLEWLRPDGSAMQQDDWSEADRHCACAVIRMAAQGDDSVDDTIFAVFNAGEAMDVTLPSGTDWQPILDTGHETGMPADGPLRAGGALVHAGGQSVLAFAGVPFGTAE